MDIRITNKPTLFSLFSLRMKFTAKLVLLALIISAYAVVAPLHVTPEFPYVPCSERATC